MAQVVSGLAVLEKMNRMPVRRLVFVLLLILANVTLVISETNVP